MKALSDLETAFQQYLMHDHATIKKHIVSTDKVSADERLAVYGNAYHSRLVDALADTYPALQLFLGDEAFQALGQAYVAAHPSSHRSIRWFGEQLAQFLKEYQAGVCPYLSELAAFEWALSLAFDAADDEIITLAAIAQLPAAAWTDLRLQTHSSVQLLSLSWNVVALWQALLNDGTRLQPIMSKKVVTWVIWRHQLETQFSSLVADEAYALGAVREGKTFAEICEGLCEWNTEEAAGPRAASLLKGWILAGMIRSL